MIKFTTHEILIFIYFGQSSIFFTDKSYVYIDLLTAKIGTFLADKDLVKNTPDSDLSACKFLFHKLKLLHGRQKDVLYKFLMTLEKYDDTGFNPVLRPGVKGILPKEDYLFSYIHLNCTFLEDSK